MQSKKIQKLIDELVNIGLSTYEAKAYLALIKNPDISAYEISKDSGVPQSKVYETIKKMAKKGIVITKGKNPVKYIALPIEEFLERYKVNIDNSIDYIKKNITALNEEVDVEYMWHFKDLNQINNKLISLINDAKKSLYIEIWNSEFEFFYEYLMKANDRGVDIVTVLYGESDKKVGTMYYHQMDGMDEHVYRVGRWITVIADEKECLFGIYKPSESSAIWTQNKSFMLLAEDFIVHDIMIAEIYSKHKELLNKEFGLNMKKIREKIDIG